MHEQLAFNMIVKLIAETYITSSLIQPGFKVALMSLPKLVSVATAAAKGKRWFCLKPALNKAEGNKRCMNRYMSSLFYEVGRKIHDREAKWGIHQ